MDGLRHGTGDAGKGVGIPAQAYGGSDALSQSVASNAAATAGGIVPAAEMSNPPLTSALSAVRS